MKKLLLTILAILFFGGVIFIGIRTFGQTPSVVVPTPVSVVALKTHSDSVSHWIKVYSEEYKIPSKMLESVFFQESRFLVGDTTYRSWLVGDGGRSFGIGQVQIRTAQNLWKDSAIVITGKKLRLDVQFNIKTSAKLLRLLYDNFEADYKKDKDVWLATLTCYNTGEGSFIKHGRRFNGYSIEVYKNFITQ